jgi:hypothetical protein
MNKALIECQKVEQFLKSKKEVFSEAFNAKYNKKTAGKE